MNSYTKNQREATSREKRGGNIKHPGGAHDAELMGDNEENRQKNTPS
jgi:hypothetical protein